MSQSSLRKSFYYLLLFMIICLLAELAGYAGMCYKSRGVDYLSNSGYLRIRDMLMANNDPKTFPKYLSQPYLGYIPNPGYVKYDSVQHNEDGYRGRKVPLLKGHKLRILCLGGSVTYGLGVKYPSQTYPARLDSLLNVMLANNEKLKTRYSGIEVMNGGVEAATSADELAYYTYKYRYYKPDLVILNSGINDALVSPGDKNYQPDYTHYRRMDFNLKPLPRRSRWLLHSHFISFIIISLFYDHYLGETAFFQQDGTVKYCHWNRLNNDSLVAAGNYEYYAFYRNINSLIKEIRNDSAYVFAIPSVLNPDDKVVRSNNDYRRLVSLNNKIMEAATLQNKGQMISFAYDSIPDPACWLDDCHVNETGELMKARIVGRKIMEIMEGK